jgi:hypothetical protein
MKGITNYAKINDEGKLEIHTDNATLVNCETSTQIGENDAYTIFGKDLMQLYAILQDKKVMAIRGLRNGAWSYTDIIIVGENAEAKELATMCKTLLDAIENFNNTRHWWERKIKITEDI